MGNMYIDSMTNKHFSFCLFFYYNTRLSVFLPQSCSPHIKTQADIYVSSCVYVVIFRPLYCCDLSKSFKRNYQVIDDNCTERASSQSLKE